MLFIEYRGALDINFMHPDNFRQKYFILDFVESTY